MFEQVMPSRVEEIRFEKDCIGEIVHTEDEIVLKDVDVTKFMMPMWEDAQVDCFMSEPGVWDLLITRYFKPEIASKMIELVANGANMKGPDDASNSSED